MSVLRVGITATRLSIVPPQQHALGLALREQRVAGGAQWLHHGDCVGGDALAHDIGAQLGFRIVIHPPQKHEFRAWCEGDEMRDEKGYWARNRDIVDEVDLLIGCPKAGTSLKDWRTSGTWYTIRYAHERDVPVLLVYSDGRAFGVAA